ncbi:hypothetical protein RhiirB3_445291 [Rhizophagus irregularis]|nr:hypothetical protein RhiirB3_438828 [Rhizophagus irregularis]PKY28903.1 hypothetical protein RhiirB3_445291 [Rhizophagus irregularis]
MTSNSNNDTDNNWIQWIKDVIVSEYINYHDYNEIGIYWCWRIYRANWKCLNTNAV